MKSIFQGSPWNYASIDERLAARRDWALTRALGGSTSMVLRPRASKPARSPRNPKVKKFDTMIVEAALNFLRRHAGKQL